MPPSSLKHLLSLLLAVGAAAVFSGPNAALGAWADYNGASGLATESYAFAAVSATETVVTFAAAGAVGAVEEGFTARGLGLEESEEIGAQSLGTTTESLESAQVSRGVTMSVNLGASTEAGAVAGGEASVGASLERAGQQGAAAFIESSGTSTASSGGDANAVNAWSAEPMYAQPYQQQQANAAVGGGGSAAEGTENFVNLASPSRTTHILTGDGPGSGGHLWPGQAGKTPFPQSWSGDKIMHEVSDIATDPAYQWVRPDGKTSWFYNSGKPARFKVIDPATGGVPVRGGVPIRVIVEPGGEGIITGFPE